jgi:chromosome segregation ATPase
MKRLILQWIFSTAGIIAIILLITFGITKVNQSIEARGNANAGAAEISVLRAYLIDSTQTSNRAANKAYRDSIAAVESKKTAIAKQEAQKHKTRADYYANRYGVQKTKADSLVREYRRDTTSRSGKCDEAIASLEQADKELEAENKELDAENFELDKECQGYSNQLYQAREQRKDDSTAINTQKRLISAQNAEIEVYKKNQKKAESGFKKAEKWVFAVAGAVITFLIMK